MRNTLSPNDDNVYCLLVTPLCTPNLKVGIQIKGVVVRDTNTRLGVVRDTLLKEVCLARERNGHHPLERVGDIVVTGTAEGDQEAIGAELNVLAHELAIHANEFDGQRVGDKDLFNVDSVSDDLRDALLGQLVDEFVVDHAGKVAVESLVAADELVGETKTGHESTLLEPEDCAEGSREEDSFNGGKSNAAFSERRIVAVAPLEGPLGLLFDTGDGLDGAEEVLLLHGVLDVGVDEERVRLRVDVLDGDLESVEAARLGRLDLGGEVLREVFVNDSVGGGEEGQHVRHEVSLVLGERLPVVEVSREVDLLGGPEGRLGLLVHVPDLWGGRAGQRAAGTARAPRHRNTYVVVLDRKEHEAVRILLQQRLLGVLSGFFSLLVLRLGAGSLGGLLHGREAGRLDGSKFGQLHGVLVDRP